MTAGTCPTCGKPLDPLRAPSVKVIAGKITAFCSPVCAGRAITEPTGVPISMVPAKESVQVTAIPPAESKAAKTQAAADDVRKKPPAAVVEDEVADSPSRKLRVRRMSSGPDDGLVEEPQHPPYDAPYDEPDDDADHEDDEVDLRERAREQRSGRKWGRILWLAGAIFAAGGAFVLLSNFVSPSHPRAADAASHPAPPPPAPDKPKGPQHADPAAVYAKAKATLTQLLASPSDRIRRVAAIGLARVGDKPAIDYLAKSLETETSAISRTEDAFALARAGDKRGKDALMAGLQSPRRDVRSDSATYLLMLGDKAGAAFMTDTMGYDQFKLSAAESLARTGDAKAIAALRAALADAKAPKEQHQRAARALAYAGQPDVAPELVAELTDKDERAMAAPALARLGDRAASDPLTDALDSEALRVTAAIALRRLDEKSSPHLDPAIWADHLAPALAAGRDTDQASAGEAALILLGPSTLAEHE
jgi:HEAT repeat protein